MFLVVVLIIIAVLAVWSESPTGKLVLGCAVLALGAVILSWILDIAFLITLAKWLVVIIIVTILAIIFLAIIHS